MPQRLGGGAARSGIVQIERNAEVLPRGVRDEARNYGGCRRYAVGRSAGENLTSDVLKVSAIGANVVCSKSEIQVRARPLALFAGNGYLIERTLPSRGHHRPSFESGGNGIDVRVRAQFDRAGETAAAGRAIVAGPAGERPRATSRPPNRWSRYRRYAGTPSNPWNQGRRPGTARRSGLAQLVEQLTVNQRVVGSSPTSGAK
jgi:hypothetical protein